MRKRAYEIFCRKLFKKARQNGFELEFEPQRFDHRRLNCLWYGGHIATLKVSPTCSIVIEAIGDVRATLFDKAGEEECFVKDEQYAGRFYDEMAYYIQNDFTLSKLIENGRLILDNNNWIECNGIVISKSGENEFVDLGMRTDNILDDDLLHAIEQVINDAHDIEENILFLKEED